MMFQHPALLFLLLVNVPLLVWYVKKWRNSNPSVGMSTISTLKPFRATFKVALMHSCFVLQLCVRGGKLRVSMIPSDMGKCNLCGESHDV